MLRSERKISTEEREGEKSVQSAEEREKLAKERSVVKESTEKEEVF